MTNVPGHLVNDVPTHHIAEVEGFEPPEVLPSLAFKASAFGRSATLPPHVKTTCALPS